MVTMLLIVALVMAMFILFLVIQLTKAWRQLDAKEKEQHVKDFYLDYVFRTYSLHIRDPHVVKPGFNEKRCYHCHYPAGEGHAADCAWLMVEPLRTLIYRTRN